VEDFEMGPLTHYKLSLKALGLSQTPIAKRIRAQKEWLELKGYWRAADYAAGVPGMPDNVLSDFLFQCFPRNIWVIKQLAEEIIKTMQSDPSKASFMTQLSSHYLVDAPWIGHRLKNIFKNDRVGARETHDYLECKTDAVVSDMLDDEFSCKPIGYWRSFWETLFDADSKVVDLIKDYKNDEVFFSSVKENIWLNLQTYWNFMRYIDMRNKLSLTSDVCSYASGVFSGRGLKVYSEGGQNFLANAKLIAFNIGTSEKKNLELCLTDKMSEAHIILAPDNSAPSITIKGNKAFLTASEDEIGNLTDVFLDISDADFGATESRKSSGEWPGNYFISWSGKRIRNEILTEDFYHEFMKATEKGRFRTDDELLDPEKATPVSKPGIIDFLEEEKDFSDRYCAALK
jgi:hypothetical protein